MYTIDLDTFSEDRLIKSVNEETYLQGKAMFERGLARVVEISDKSAHCIVQDKRSYHVYFKIDKQHLYLQCSCFHAARGLICEHDVAAWLSVSEKLTVQIPPEWRHQLDKMINIGLPQTRNHRSPYYLFFSLQKDPENSSLTWRITAHVLPANALPSGCNPLQLGEKAWIEYIEQDPQLTLRLRSPNRTMSPEDCLNSNPQGIRLAKLIYERRYPHYYYSFAQQDIPLEDFLPLLRQTGGQLFFGDQNQPLKKFLQLGSEKAELALNMDMDQQGLQISPLLSLEGQMLEISPEDVRVIREAPVWILYQHWLVELSERSNLELLRSFRSASQLSVPLADIDDFRERYLLDLASLFPLRGNALAWEEISPTPTPRLYLSEADGELVVQLRIAYDAFEFPCEANPPAESLQQKSGLPDQPSKLTLVRVQRQIEQERQFFSQLSGPSFGLKRAPLTARLGLFRLRARVHPVDFLLNSLPRLAQAGYEIYGEDKLKTARVNRNTPSISFRVSSGIDWFDVQAVVNFGDLQVPFQEIRRLLRKRERYVKLSDGTIGEIPEEWLERYRHLFAIGETKEEGLRFSRHHLGLIDQTLAQADKLNLDEEFLLQRKKLQALLSNDFHGIQSRPLPSDFRGALRPYQKSGFDWLHFLHENRFGGCLADDMGLGKTIQTLVFLQSLYEKPPEGESNLAPAPALPASLLVVPRSLLVNWQREAERFTPGLRMIEFFESNRARDLEGFEGVDLVITTYGVMLRDIQFLHGYEFYYAILDESQSIKNPLSQTARAAHLLKARHRLVLTGTPIENSTAELWSQFAFLNPGLLGNLKYFKTEYGLPIEKKQDQRAAENLRKIVYPFILRRTKGQVAPELPPRTERILYCDMEAAQRKLYQRTRDYYRGALLGMLDRQSLEESRMKILEGLLRLRQVSIHPQLMDEKFHGTSGKFELLLETLDTLKAEGHKVLIFSQFVKMLSLLRREIDQRHVPYTYLDGQTQSRQEQVDRFQNDPGIPFFLISLKAGGLGLNLTAADYVIHIDPWWNPAVEMQASDRTHRIGQDKPVFVFKLITRDSVEEKILLLQERKQALVEKIITTENAFFKNLTLEDVQVLFS